MFKPERPPQKILVIAIPYLGDVLLATPVTHSLKKTFPQCQVDMLVYANAAAVLEGNQDLHQIISISNRPSISEHLALYRKIFRDYDLAIALQTSDRPFFYSLAASSRRLIAVPPKGSKGAWKRFFCSSYVEFDNEGTHTVVQNLKLIKSLDIPAQARIISPHSGNILSLQSKFPWLGVSKPFVILHPHPQWTYKRWLDSHWKQLALFIDKAGYLPVFSGSPAPAEREYITAILDGLGCEYVDLSGQVCLAELADILRYAALYVGPDTGTTHLAAAAGIPVIALYGPTNPVKWAPWPKGHDAGQNPFVNKGDQQVNNIYLLQGQGDCVPCYEEGCDRHRNSRSHCLDTLPLEKVKVAIKQALNLNS